MTSRTKSTLLFLIYALDYYCNTLMKLSIIICTFNRAEQLEQLLDDLTTQYKRLKYDDAKEIEVILVDNNSFDNTGEVAYRFIENTGISIKFFTEKKLGLCASRNLGITKASGDLLAFIHDDVTLDDDWLREAIKIANKCLDQEIGVYGGRSIPIWQESFPDWLNLEPPYQVKQDVFTGHSFGDEERFYPFSSEYGIAEFPCSANVLIRKEIFENCGNFRTDLGPSASGGFGMHDDYEIFEYLMMLKIPILYSPQLIVFHPVGPEKMTMQNIRRWYFNSGRALFWISHTDRMKREAHPLIGIAPQYRKLIPEFAKTKVQGIPLYLYLKLSIQGLWWLGLHLSFDLKKRNWLSYKISETLGEIDAAALVTERIHTRRKFSFKDRLVKKGIASTI